MGKRRYQFSTTTALGLGSISTLTLGLLPSAATASDRIKLSLGGFYDTAYQVNFDDDGKNDLGSDRNTDGLFTDAEIWFDGKVTLDNGLDARVHIELEGEQEDDQIDESWVSLNGGWGGIRLGTYDDALEEQCITPPGGTANFGAFSPDMIAANLDAAGLSSNTVCTGLTGNAHKIGYMTPLFEGFQFAFTYVPDAGSETDNKGSGGHNGMIAHTPGQARHGGSAYATYIREGDDWGVAAGGGVAFDGHVENGADASSEEAIAYQGALNLTFGRFSVGGAMEYFDDIGIVDGGSLTRAAGARSWFAGIGMSYAPDPVTLGLQYSYGDSELATTDHGGTNDDVNQRRVVLTGIYSVGPGIDLDAEIGYTWLASEAPKDDAIDDYDSLELGIGTAFTF